ncbi:MAG: hypothetical protein EOP84_06115 [Verrucomicrobiaceae bacterium]|nr:MAG: hypothetical protein EOP84_06115 [Verrucomicrobiaceae bacterium]
MRSRTSSALLFLLLLSACATTEPSLGELEAPKPRFANLQRAAQYPWTDDGQCVVREASNEWPLLAERCFHALDHDRVRFRDVTGRCAVASAGAVGVGLCIFVAPEIIVGAIIVTGVVVVAVAIKEEWDESERSASRERARPKTQTRSSIEQEPVADREPTPRGVGQDWFPPVSSDSTERPPDCRPIPVPHAGGDDPHDECADKFPPNRYPGKDVLVGGKRFDALQVGVRRLWEIKTYRFDTYAPFVRNQVIDDEIEEFEEERNIALSCGYGFVVGVSTEAHKEALERASPELEIVVTGCTR